jgi:molecular chaperone DnaJ
MALRNKTGHLLVRLRIRLHPGFERKGRDMHSHVEVLVTVAALGGEVSLPTLRAQVKPSIPAGG